jgi:hypothetical protein
MDVYCAGSAAVVCSPSRIALRKLAMASSGRPMLSLKLLPCKVPEAAIAFRQFQLERDIGGGVFGEAVHEFGGPGQQQTARRGRVGQIPNGVVKFEQDGTAKTAHVAEPGLGTIPLVLGDTGLPRGHQVEPNPPFERLGSGTALLPSD